MIVSRQLKEGLTLVRGKESLKIKSLIRTGRSCTAVVTNAKGKEEKLTITDMWNQKVSILNPEKEIPAKAKVVKETKPVKAKVVQIKKPAEKLVVITHELHRANGIATVYYDSKGRLTSSWKRTS